MSEFLKSLLEWGALIANFGFWALAAMIVFVILAAVRQMVAPLFGGEGGRTRGRGGIALNIPLTQIHRDTDFDLRPPLFMLEQLKKGAKRGRAEAKVEVRAESGENPEDVILKLQEQLQKKVDQLTKVVAVLHFQYDRKGMSPQLFARMVDEVIVNKDSISKVIVVVNSPGGPVSTYGFLCSQMERIRNAGLELHGCTDEYAASGGYMMIMPCNKISADPLSTVGSVGVVAEIPNFHKVLERLGVENHLFTAGRHKRTVTMLNKVEEDGKQHFQEQLDSIHKQFLDRLRLHRPNANFGEIETAAHWTAQETVDRKLGLVDELKNSYDVIMEANRDSTMLFIEPRRARFQSIIEPMVSSFAEALVSASERMMIRQKSPKS